MKIKLMDELNMWRIQELLTSKKFWSGLVLIAMVLLPFFGMEMPANLVTVLIALGLISTKVLEIKNGN